jgi:hypothetical protein
MAERITTNDFKEVIEGIVVRREGVTIKDTYWAWQGSGTRRKNPALMLNMSNGQVFGLQVREYGTRDDG